MTKLLLAAAAAAFAHATVLCEASTIVVVVGDESIPDGLAGGASNPESDNALTGSNNLGGRAQGDDFLAYTVSLDDFVTFGFSIPSGETISSATLNIDITDDDNRTLTIREGTGGVATGALVGTTTPVGDNGTPGDWRAINFLTSGGLRPGGNTSPGNIDHTFAIPPSLFADMQTNSQLVLDGEWSSTGNGFWASNRAKLTIETVPEPSSLVSALVGGLALLVRRNRH